eukprot:s577_g12.t1
MNAEKSFPYNWPNGLIQLCLRRRAHKLPTCAGDYFMARRKMSKMLQVMALKVRKREEKELLRLASYSIRCLAQMTP